jgi:hypothetical protein
MEEKIMGKINKGVLRLGSLLIALVLVMMVAFPVSAANSPKSSPLATQIIQGKVLSIISNASNNGSFIIQNASEQEVTIITNASTKYYLIKTGKVPSLVGNIINNNPKAKSNGRTQSFREDNIKNAHIPAIWRDNLGWLGNFERQASFSDIQVGDRVIARTANDGSNLAKEILIIKAPVNRTIKGTVNSLTVTSGSPAVLSITPTGGSAPLLLNITAQTIITLKGIAVIQPGQTVIAVYNSTNNNALTVNIHVP